MLRTDHDYSLILVTFLNVVFYSLQIYKLLNLYDVLYSTSNRQGSIVISVDLVLANFSVLVSVSSVFS